MIYILLLEIDAFDKEHVSLIGGKRFSSIAEARKSIGAKGYRILLLDSFVEEVNNDEINLIINWITYIIIEER